MVKTAVEVREVLKSKGYECSLINARFIKPLDTELITELAKNHQILVTMEENVINGGFGEHVVRYLNESAIENSQIKVINIAIPDEYVEHGNVEILRQEIGIDKEYVVRRILAEYAKIRERL